MNNIFAALSKGVGQDVIWLIAVWLLVIVGFSFAAPNFLSWASAQSIASQLPVLGLLTLAMLVPIVSGGLNLAIVYSANISGLGMAWVLVSMGGPEAGISAFLIGVLVALAVGIVFGALMGAIIAYVGAHPILVSLAMMVFLRGVGEYLTRGADISGFPDFVNAIGYGDILNIPIPLIIFLLMAILWGFLLDRSRHGFTARMVGSNIKAAAYSGLDTKRNLVLIYALSGAMSAVAGIVMLTQFNSVRVGHGEALLLVTVLGCFLGGVDPFGGFGRVLPVVIALFILQTLSSGLNLVGANQHLSTAVWGIALIAVMVLRNVAGPLLSHKKRQ